MRKILLTSCASALLFFSCANSTQYVGHQPDLLLNQASAATTQQNPEVNLYQKEELQNVISLLRQPVKPVRIPSTILRILFLPHVNEQDVLEESFYVYTKVHNGRWLLGNYLVPTENQPVQTRMLTPLDMPINTVSANQNTVPQPQNNQKQPQSQAKNIPFAKPLPGGVH